MTVRQINYATIIQFGRGALARLPAVLAWRRITQPLLLSDPGVVAAGLLNKVRYALGDTRHGVIDDLPLHPDEEFARNVAARYSEGGYDGIVSIGGGSVTDMAKAVRLIASDPAPLAGYLRADGPRPYPRLAHTLIAIPTTAGTGSEISRGVPIWSGGRRLVLMAPELAPTEAILDPVMTLTLPVAISVATAYDALAHCVEGYLSPFSGPPYDALALAGAARLAGALPELAKRPDDLEVRERVMMGGLEGGISMQLGLGAVHGLGIPLDASGLHHGRIIGALLAPFIEAYGASQTDRGKDLARAMGDAGRVLHEILEELALSTGLERRLPVDLTVPEKDALVESAISSPYHASSPASLTRKDYHRLLNHACAGDGGL